MECLGWQEDERPWWADLWNDCFAASECGGYWWEETSNSSSITSGPSTPNEIDSDSLFELVENDNSCDAFSFCTMEGENESASCCVIGGPFDEDDHKTIASTPTIWEFVVDAMEGKAAIESRNDRLVERKASSTKSDCQQDGSGVGECFYLCGTLQYSTRPERCQVNACVWAPKVPIRDPATSPSLREWLREYL